MAVAVACAPSGLELVNDEPSEQSEGFRRVGLALRSQSKANASLQCTIIREATPWEYFRKGPIGGERVHP